MLFYNAQIYNNISIVIKIKSMSVGGRGVRCSLSIFHWKFKNCVWSTFVLVKNQCRIRLTYFPLSIMKKTSTNLLSPAHKELKRENFSFTYCVCVHPNTNSVTHMCMHACTHTKTVSFNTSEDKQLYYWYLDLYSQLFPTTW